MQQKAKSWDTGNEWNFIAILSLTFVLVGSTDKTGAV